MKWFRKPRRTLKWILLNIRQNSKCSWRNVVKWETRFFSRGCERVREKCSAFVGFDYGWIAFFVCIRLLFYSNVYMLVSVYTSSSLNSWDFREFDFHLCAMWYDIFLSFWFGSFVCAMNLSHSAQYNSFELWSTLRQTIAKVYIYIRVSVCATQRTHYANGKHKIDLCNLFVIATMARKSRQEWYKIKKKWTSERASER